MVKITDEMVTAECLNVPELFGTTEFGNVLGWPRQKISVYLKREIMPVPAAVIGSRPIWTKLQVYKYAADHDIKIHKKGAN
jgi:hypothetical protein